MAAGLNHCSTSVLHRKPMDSDLLTLYNCLFPLLNQQSWTFFCLSNFHAAEVSFWNGRVEASSRTRTTHWTNWTYPMSHIWGWTLTFRTPCFAPGSYVCPAYLHKCNLATTEEESKLTATQLLAHSRLLVRQFLWTKMQIPQR